MNTYRNIVLKNKEYYYYNFINHHINRQTMKFKLLSIGQKFKFEDEVYVKTSPIVASNVETGHNKMIPRYAVLTLLDNSSEEIQPAIKEPVAVDKVLTQFNLFYENCITVLDKNDVLAPIIKDELDRARDKFTQYLTQ